MSKRNFIFEEGSVWEAMARIQKQDEELLRKAAITVETGHSVARLPSSAEPCTNRPILNYSARTITTLQGLVSAALAWAPLRRGFLVFRWTGEKVGGLS